MAGVAIVLDLLKKSQTKQSLHSSSFTSASAAALSAAASAPFASRFLFGYVFFCGFMVFLYWYSDWIRLYFTVFDWFTGFDHILF